MSCLVSLIKIVITGGNKGGTGKTTTTALLTEYLTYQNKKVNLIDTDPSCALQIWVSNCQEEGRIVSSRFPVDYQIIDTAGVSGGSLGYIKQADIIIVPFVPNYIDLQVIIPWYNSLTWEQKKKVFFLPNRYQKTKEQKDGLEQLESETGRDEKTGKEMKLAKEKKKQLSKVLSPLSSRPALYGSILNGSKKNFFTNRSNSNQAEEIFIELFKKYEKNKKSNKSY